MDDVTALLARLNDGAPGARDALFGSLYPQLRRLAHARLGRSGDFTLLDTTALVHESYLRWSRSEGQQFADRGTFFAFAASVMRSVIVDELRRRQAERRGGDATKVPLDDVEVAAAARAEDQVLDVAEALKDLAAIDARLARVVEMRYFAGFTEAEIAQALGLTERTVRRDWDKARALLRLALA